MSNITDIDSLVLFAFDTSHEIAHFLRGDHWKEQTYQSWETDGFDLLRTFVLEDVSSTQLKARMSSVTSTKRKLMGQARLYENHKKGNSGQNDAFKTLSNLISWEGFQKECLEKESLIMDAIKHSLTDSNKTSMSVAPTSKAGRSSMEPS